MANQPWVVTFRGPLSDSAAKQAIIDVGGEIIRQPPVPTRRAGGQYIVEARSNIVRIDADSAGEAIEKLTAALEPHGEFSGFVATAEGEYVE